MSMLPHGAQPEPPSGLPDLVILQPCKRQPPPRWCAWKSTIQHRPSLEVSPRFPAGGASTVQRRPSLEVAPRNPAGGALTIQHRPSLEEAPRSAVGGVAMDESVASHWLNLTQLACVWIRHTEERDHVEEAQANHKTSKTSQLPRLNRISACGGLPHNLVENVRAALEHRDKPHNQATLRRVGNCDVESESGWTAQFCKPRTVDAPFAPEPDTLTWDAATRSVKRLLPRITVSYSYYLPPGDAQPGGVGYQCRANLQRFVRVGLPQHSSLAPNVVLN
eukprot:2866842-Prymnesium_polylepis.2